MRLFVRFAGTDGLWLRATGPGHRMLVQSELVLDRLDCLRLAGAESIKVAVIEKHSVAVEQVLVPVRVWNIDEVALGYLRLKLGFRRSVFLLAKWVPCSRLVGIAEVAGADGCVIHSRLRPHALLVLDLVHRIVRALERVRVFVCTYILAEFRVVQLLDAVLY